MRDKLPAHFLGLFQNQFLTVAHLTSSPLQNVTLADNPVSPNDPD
jgi:hypothetical protein